jgi:hypothetical protein
MNTSESRLFSRRQIVVITVAFVGIVVAAQRALRYICDHWIPFDCPYYWPVSTFGLRVPSVRDLVVAAAVLLAFFLFVRLLEVKLFDIRLVILSGALLIAGLTFIHGIDVGFYAPVAGDAQSGTLVPYSLEGQEYYHDALAVTDPVDFLRNYNELQPNLHRHAHTHPPGAVLIYYFLAKVFRDPAIIAIAIMLLSLVPTVSFFYRLLLTEIEDRTARFVSFLFILLPAVQIYYLASMDALVAALLTAALYLFCFGKGSKSVAGAAVAISASFLLTFVTLFILPVLAGFELIVKRSFKRSAIVAAVIAAVHLLLYFGLGYDAVQSFRTASLFENPQGFMLFVDPANYFFTRLEDVAEIIFFFGPFLAILSVRGLKDLKNRPLNVIAALGCATLVGMFVTGAWRTGETARPCLFLYPYLLFPVAYYLNEREDGSRGRLQLASLVFAQAVGMQLLGNYHW